MARRKRKVTTQAQPITTKPEVEEVSPDLPDDAIPRPDVAPEHQSIPWPRCPYCRSRAVRRVSGGGGQGVVYYRCLKCADPETGDYTRFKISRS